MRRIIAITKKEIKQLFRDKRMLFVIFFFPVLLLGVFGYAVNFDVQNVQLAVYDKENSDLSRDFVRSISSSTYFTITTTISKDSEIKETLDRKEAQVVLVIPKDFSEKIYYPKEHAKVQFLIDGVDGNTATIIQNYVTSATYSFTRKLQEEKLAEIGMKPGSPIELKSVFWFNPNLETTMFLIPGLIALILIVTAVITVSLTLVREKENGTIEQINVSSLTTLELLIGKSIPYIAIALINAIFILIAGYFLFDVIVKGSLSLLFLSTLIFLMASTSLGIFISVVSESQQVAFSLATFASLLPSVILSGFIFPIDSMPWIIQVLTNLTPTKFFIISLRAIILKGVGLQAFWPQLVYLLLFTFVMMALSTVINIKKIKSA